MNDPKPVRRRATIDPNNSARTNDRSQQNLYQPYKDAEWGFINHWYPALWSAEVKDGDAVGVQICGIPIVLRRAKGKVYALRDQCIHRGVPLSRKPLCLTDDTITCWYHGFTFDLESGKLVSILAAPDDQIINTTGIMTYPAQEVNGMIFVFVRDEEFGDDIPPLSTDIPIRYPQYNEKYPHPLWSDPAGVLDDDVMVLGIHRTGEANWRIACENGFDGGHLLIHKDNAICIAREWSLPLGARPVSEEAFALLEDDQGPKGFLQRFDSEHWEFILENKRLNIKVDGMNGRPYRTSMVLPGVLMVENWPEEGVTQYEWYVPITDDTYEYWEVLVKKCPTEKDKRDFQHKYDKLYLPLCLRGFNDCDLYARDAMQDFYADGTGWDDEQLGDMDKSVIIWRKQASRHNRGIAPSAKGTRGAVKGSSQRFAQAADGKKIPYKVEPVEG